MNTTLLSCLPAYLKTVDINLCGKLTDFGVLRLPDGGVLLGGSRPWQAPECSRGAFFKLEEAKRTDVYSFGMLIWRVFLDGDPFKSLGPIEGKTAKEIRQCRNKAIASLKEEDSLIRHVCNSLASSEKFSRLQLETLCEVISTTLVKDSTRREMDVRKIIRLLAPKNWYEAEHSVAPTRLPTNPVAQLLDMEKWHSEFDKVSPVVQSFIASGYKDCADGRPDQLKMNREENRSAAAYQLAICYANGFGVRFDSDECLKWLVIAAERGSKRAQEALPQLVRAFDTHASALPRLGAKADYLQSLLSSPCDSESSEGNSPCNYSEGKGAGSIISSTHTVPTFPSCTFLHAAESCNYEALDALLLSSAKPIKSEDGVSPIHFLSSWDASRAESLGARLILAGADVNARAKRGPSVGGTPLMWSVYGDHIEHSLILIKLGAEPMLSTEDGDDALSFAARSHLTAHLRVLLENVCPARVRGHIPRLIEAAAGGESRFARMKRHGERWTAAARHTLHLLQDWNALFPDTDDIRALLIPALQITPMSTYGRMNWDVQIDFIKSTAIKPSDLKDVLRKSILTFNQELFDALLDYGVPVTALFEHQKGLLHLCAKIPDHSFAATAFAPRLLDLGADLDGRDEDGVTAWMDAILERKWDLADLLMNKGADAFATNKAGLNVLGLCITAVNLGSIKYLMKYCAQHTKFKQDSFLVNREKQISALQLAAALPLPRGHGMRLETVGVFLTVLAKFVHKPWQLNFRSSGILPAATALDIAASQGNVHAVTYLVKRGAHLADGSRAIELAHANLYTADDAIQKKNLERCAFVIGNWDNDEKQTRVLADTWTSMRTMGESRICSSWEIVAFDYWSRKGIGKFT